MPKLDTYSSLEIKKSRVHRTVVFVSAFRKRKRKANHTHPWELNTQSRHIQSVHTRRLAGYARKVRTGAQIVIGRVILNFGLVCTISADECSFIFSGRQSHCVPALKFLFISLSRLAFPEPPPRDRFSFISSSKKDAVFSLCFSMFLSAECVSLA